MGDALRSIRIATKDQSVLTTARAALSSAQGDGVLEGFEVQQVEAWRDLVEAPPAPGDVLVLDSWLKDGNVYEMLRHLAGRTKCRTYVLIEGENRVAEPIARFCGATGVIERPITRAKLQALLGESGGPRPALASEGVRRPRAAELHVPRDLLAELTGNGGSGETAARAEADAIMGALIDPVTGLFNYSFLSYKLDEEFKRARRFHAPLACAMLGFESQASDDTLRELSSIFLAASRDTDVLGRFDENSFLFLLPNTGPDGAEIMAQRVANTADESRLLDLVGDRIELSIGIANFPSPNIHRREDLYASAREAFLEARQAGGGVVVSAL